MKPFRERNPVIIGLISMTTIALLLLAAFRAQDLPVIGGGEIYHADFTEAGGLRAGDEVRIAGVRVGSVKSIELDGGHVKVTMRVKTDSRFGPQTRADIKIKTLLGSEFVMLVPDGDGQLESGATIPTERTSSPFDVVDAFSGLASTASDIDTDQLGKSLTVLADLTRNTPEEFRGALSGISALSNNIADKNARINRLLKNLDRVTTVLDARDDDIIDIMQDSDVLFRALVQRRAAVHRLLVSTRQLSIELTTLINKTRKDLNPALQHLDSVVNVLNKNENNIDKSLQLLAPFYRVFANTLGNGPWFDTYIQNLPPVPAVPLPTGLPTGLPTSLPTSLPTLLPADGGN